MSLLLVGLWFINRWAMHSQPEEEPTVATLAEAEAPDAGVSRDGGTSDLGDTALTARVPQQDVPGSSKVIAQKVPKEPFDGQRRPPCDRGQLAINGGCWASAPHPPPCGEQAYEWKGSCYWPILQNEKPRPPTSTKP
jgi:hypothetical protein